MDDEQRGVVARSSFNASSRVVALFPHSRNGNAPSLQRMPAFKNSVELLFHSIL
jgi:hypothetical protein